MQFTMVAQGYFCDTHMQELRIRPIPASIP